LIVLNDGPEYTLPIMLANIRSGADGSVDFGALQAGVVVATVPCLVLYLVLQLLRSVSDVTPEAPRAPRPASRSC
jgi:ABC-type glycerol-3-phosphate transport system permease component